MVSQSIEKIKELAQQGEKCPNVTFAQVQKPAPSFTTMALVNGEFKEVSLESYAGKYVVLIFYPLDFTFVCPTEIIAFNDRKAEFEAVNTEILLCSVDSHFSHLAWTNVPRNQGGLGPITVPMLADINKSIARNYGVLLDDGVAARGTFIIDNNGTLRQFSVNDPPVGRSVDEVLRLVKAYQFVDVHGEVCPINWTPGSSTIIPDVKKSKTFFEKITTH